MCRILLRSGYKNFSVVEKEKFKEALSLMKNGGPDHQASVSHKANGYEVLLGHNRLSIIDTSEASNQPMVSRNGKIRILFNGEIYNYKELIKRYDLRPRTSGDTEVVLLMYERFGIESLLDLDGEFAIVIVDDIGGIIHAARDPMGIKHLYYWFNGGDLFISSEIKAISQQVGTFLNVSALQDLMYYGYVAHPEGTMFDGILKIQPGVCLSFHPDGGITNKYEYFRLRYSGLSLKTGAHSETLAKELKQEVVKAVKKRMMSDVPISCTLSGGIDSSIIASIMAQNSSKVKTYTLAIEGFPDELKKAKRFSKHIGSDHREIVISADKIFKEIDNIVYALDEPMDKGSVIPTYFLGRNIGTKVTLIGEGADELFGGYDRYIKWYGDVSKGKRVLGYRYMRDSLAIFPDSGTTLDLLGMASQNGTIDLHHGYSNTALYIDLISEIPNYHNPRIDKLMMNGSVEARVPYLDPSVVGLALEIPFDYKMNPEKAILRKAFEEDLPPWVLNRRKNALKIPYDSLVQRREVKDVIFGKNFDDIQLEQIVPKESVLRIYDQGPEKIRNGGRALWLIYLYIKWYERYFKR